MGLQWIGVQTPGALSLSLATTSSRVARAHPKVIITGGGTGGHIEPALALARALDSIGVDQREVLFVGARRGMESRLVPAAGFAIRLLPGRGLHRRIGWADFAAIGELSLAFVRAFGIVARARPKAVVMVGGYAGFASSISALVLGIPVVVVNVDAHAGLANRVIGRFAALSATAEAGSGLPRAVVTGPPIREAVLRADRSTEGQLAARARLGIEPTENVVSIVGGSLGAGRLNDAAGFLRNHFAQRSDLLIYHVAGERNLDAMRHDLGTLSEQEDHYRIVGFEPNLPDLFAASDLVVARAGAMTVTELAVIGVPSVLVPLPGAPGDHQTSNARTLEQRGGAILIPDAEATGPRLAAVIEELLADPERLESMANAAKSTARPDATQQIARLVGSVMEQPRQSWRERVARTRSTGADVNGQTGRG